MAKHETGEQGVRGGRGEDAIGSMRVECATDQECASEASRHEWHRPRAHLSCLDTARHKSRRHSSLTPTAAQFVAVRGFTWPHLMPLGAGSFSVTVTNAPLAIKVQRPSIHGLWRPLDRRVAPYSALKRDCLCARPTLPLNLLSQGSAASALQLTSRSASAKELVSRGASAKALVDQNAGAQAVGSAGGGDYDLRKSLSSASG